MKRNVELEAAEALLDAGILARFVRIRPPRRHEWVLRVTMRRPCLGGQMRIVRHYLKLGITAQRMGRILRRRRASIFPPACKETFADAGADDMPGISSGMRAGTARGMAHPLEGSARISDRGARWFRKMRGTRDFTSIIESAERINPFRYETSRPTRAGKGS